MKTMEFWENDKRTLEYMLDRCIIAKLIEDAGVQVPDTFSVYFDAPNEYMDITTYFDSVATFLSLTKIGVLKYRDMDRSDYMEGISIRIYALEELERYALTNDQRELHNASLKSFESTMELLDFTTFDGQCNVVGAGIYYRVEYIHGRASEMCGDLLTIHRNVMSLIKKIQKTQKGEL